MSARAEVEDDSQADYSTWQQTKQKDTAKHWMCDSVKDMVTALSSRARTRQNTAQVKRREAEEVKSIIKVNKRLPVCPCGLRTHQGKK